MPVLTCPFAPILAQRLVATKIRSPESITLSTELTIKPVAGETWAVEGLSFQFTTEYLTETFVNISAAYSGLTKSLTNQENSLKFIEKALAASEAQLSHLKTVEKFRKELFEAKGGAELGAALEEAVAAVEAGKNGVESAKHEVEGVKSEIEVTKKEIGELGRSLAFQASTTPPLTITARMYARGNELVWADQLSGLHFQGVRQYVKEPKAGIAEVLWRETFNDHIQFEDPIGIGERENLKLTLEFTSPSQVVESEGGREGTQIAEEPIVKLPALSEVSAVVNYSH